MTNEEKELAFRYSWEWFKYHAQQRYSAFNYFLIVIGALSWAYMQSPNCIDLNILRAAIGTIGFVISFSFLFIEKRNNELVNYGRAGLDKLEKDKIYPFDFYRIRSLDKSRFGLKHIFWFRLVIIMAIIISYVSIVYPLKCDLICITISTAIIIIVALFLAYYDEGKMPSL